METLVREPEVAIIEGEEKEAESESQLQNQAETGEITFEKLAKLNAAAGFTDGIFHELVEGELVPMSGTSIPHGEVQQILSGKFYEFLKPDPIGKIYPGVGFIFQRKPRTMRVPDLAYVSRERLPAEGTPKKGYWEFVPDVAIEIVLPDDVMYTVYEKAAEYIRFGVKEVWIIIPVGEAVMLYRSNQNVRYLTSNDKLESPEILPNFSVQVAELFED